jgi:hypothetical protein
MASETAEMMGDSSFDGMQVVLLRFSPFRVCVCVCVCVGCHLLNIGTQLLRRRSLLSNGSPTSSLHTTTGSISTTSSTSRW